MGEVIGFYTDERGKVRPLTRSTGRRPIAKFRHIKGKLDLRAIDAERDVVKVAVPTEKGEHVEREVILVRHPSPYAKVVRGELAPEARLKQRVKVEDKGDTIVVDTPFDPEFVREARRLGGKWNGSAWVFPKVMKGYVKEALDRIYGETGEGPVEVVDVRIKIDPFLDENKSLWMFNKEVFRVNSARTVSKGKGIAVVSGDVPERISTNTISGLKDKGIEVVIPNVPKALADKYAQQNPDAIKIMS